MRRRPGIGGLQTHAAARDQFRLLGENVAKIRTDLMKEQLATFRSQLEDFARKHKVLFFFLPYWFLLWTVKAILWCYDELVSLCCT